MNVVACKVQVCHPDKQNYNPPLNSSVGQPVAVTLADVHVRGDAMRAYEGAF